MIALILALFGRPLDAGYIPRQYCDKDGALVCCNSVPGKLHDTSNGQYIQWRWECHPMKPCAIPVFCSWRSSRNN